MKDEIEKIRKIRDMVLTEKYTDGEMFALQVKLLDLIEHIDLIICKRKLKGDNYGN